MPTAKINLTVTNFVDINTPAAPPRWSTISNPVIIDGAGKVTVSPTDPMTLVVRGPASINLEFTILPAGAFLPAGIAFKQTAGTTDPRGKNNFDLGSLTAGTITINDKYNDHGAGNLAPRWEFFILIQQASTGALGIIDPGIENEN